MDIEIDFSEVTLFAEAMAEAPDRLAKELTDTADALLVEGVGFAQEKAPVGDTGNLRASIRILDGPGAGGGSYGSSLEYAWQREEGGKIVARNAPMLAWEKPEGQWHFAHEVYQEGDHYMQHSVDQLEPLVDPAYEEAVGRVMDSL